MKKICTKCREEKGISQFSKSHPTRCKCCLTLMHKEYLKKHPEKGKQYDKRYYERNKQKILERDHIYQMRPDVRERKKEYNTQYAITHSEEIKEQRKEAYKQNKEKFKAQSIAYHNKMRIEHPEKVKEWQRKANHNSLEKMRKTLPDYYVAHTFNLPIQEVRKYSPLLLEVHRQHIRLHREIKKKFNQLKTKENEKSKESQRSKRVA